MIDITLIRKDPNWVREQFRHLNDQTAADRIDTIVELDSERRRLLKRVEDMQRYRKQLNKTIGMVLNSPKIEEQDRQLRAAQAVAAINDDDYDAAISSLQGNAVEAYVQVKGSEEAIEQLQQEMRTYGNRVNKLYEMVSGVETRLNEQMMWLPNIPHESVPVAESEEGNVAHEPEGAIPSVDFEPQAHWDLGPALGIIDFERGIKVAGSRGYMLTGIGARLQRALSNFFLDSALAKGYQEVYVPFFVREDMMYGSGQFPKFRDVVYYDADAEVYMLPTAEVALTNMYRDEILDEDMLSLNLVAHTPCFRREKMSAGRDTRGIKRVHQFQKVEMYKFTTPETSYDELEKLTEDASDVCRALGLPFRRLEIATGDLGFTASKKYDIEVWSQGCQEWLEVSSCSNTEAFQARRANIRYRTDNKRNEFVHTLNGSGLAVPRVMIAILENYQQKDGSVIIPEVLRPYLGGLEVIEPV